MASRSIAALAGALALAACGSDRGETGPGGVTAGEAKALDDAAEMVEKQRLPQEALRPPAARQPAAQPK